MKRYQPTLNSNKLTIIIFRINVSLKVFTNFSFAWCFSFVVIGRERLEIYTWRQNVLYGNEYMEQPV